MGWSPKNEDSKHTTCSPGGLIGTQIASAHYQTEEGKDQDGGEFETAQKDGPSGSSVINNQALWICYQSGLVSIQKLS